MFMEALLVMPKLEIASYLSADQWLDKLVHLSMEYYLAIQRTAADSYISLNESQGNHAE